MRKIQKLLAVAAVFVLAISMLCVSAVADDTVTIDGTTYDIVYSETGSWSSGGWSQHDSAWDKALMTNLATDGTYLVFVRDAEPATTVTYDKIILIDNYWTNNETFILGTGISKSSTDDSVQADCIYDDGTYIVYNGSDVYALWNGHSGDKVTFISNSGASYNIVQAMVVTPSTSTSTSYSVTIESVTGGTVTADATKGFTGDGTETVTLTVSSSSSSSAAYRISALTVTDASGATVELTNNHDGTYTFTMPASNVTVTPEFTASDLRYLYVNGMNVQNIVDYTVTCGSGTATFDYDSNTLTLDNATITCSYTTSSSSYYGIHATYYSKTVPASGLTVKLVGTNTLVSDTTGNAKYSYGLYTQYTNLHILSESDGVLTADALYYGIQAATGYSVSISDCTVSLTNVSFYALSAPKGLDISNSTVTLNAVSDGSAVRGINSSSPITITDSTVDISASATSKISYGIYTSYTTTSTSDSALIVENSTLTCTNTNTYGSYPAIYANGITASGTSTVVADGGVNFLSTKGSTHLVVDPDDGYEMSVLVGSSSSDATAYGTYSATETITSTSALDFGTYAYLEISLTGLTYNITATADENGTVTVDSTAATGDTVTVTATSASGYSVTSVSVVDANGSDVAVTDNGDGTYSFTMPAGDVTITVTTSEDTTSSSTITTISGAIYVNEQYHGYFVNGRLVCVEHTVDNNGYCTVCKEYIGVETEDTETEETETTEEVVEIADPVEDTNTETEDDGEEDVTVAEEAEETNPTTGAALALLPMAIAGLTAAISKRR